MSLPGRPACTSSLVIFGGTGDLSRRKLIPALARLLAADLLPSDLHLIITGRRPITHEQALQAIEAGLPTNRHSDVLLSRGLQHLLPRLHYLHLEPTQPESVTTFFSELRSLEGQGAAPARLFYLSVPPDSIADFLPVLKTALDKTASTPCPSRVLVEKPFGHDRASAQRINRQLLDIAREEQIFRIDHYLGKEAIQNILILRFANVFLEPLWNRQYIDHIQISFSETIGVGTRAGYFDQTGILRDVVQNHLLQVLCLIAMEAPNARHSDSIRQAKLRILQALRPMSEETISDQVIRGQYAPGLLRGQTVAGYRSEHGVPAASQTETYIAMKLFIDSWRWHQVPFYIRAGKRLAHDQTEVAVVFREAPPVALPAELGTPQPNILRIRVQPDESIIMQVQSKAPGMQLAL
ncbi:MAG TPA: glucose-6-phosphate dehydrogenase, partial [Candidatus Ozemobacteraceae bacterium]|nr:glucose-6-phosphate dehydrogenase [Candidatus Ozemobacteraceae bacterium]